MWTTPIFLVTLILTKVWPWLVRKFGVIQSRSGDLQYWYSYFTYGFIHASLMQWLSVATYLILIALIVEPRVGVRQLVKISMAALLFGGIVFAFLGTSDSYVLVGAGFLKYAYTGVLIAQFIREGKSFNIFAKIFSVYLMFDLSLSLLLLLTTLSSKPSFEGMSGDRVVGMLVAIVTLLYTLLAIRGKGS